MPVEELDKLYLSIGELAKKFNVTVSLIRFWEKEFKQFKPEKTIKGTRKYSKKNIETFSVLYRLIKTEGHTIEGAKEKLNSKVNNVILILVQRMKENLTLSSRARKLRLPSN